MYLSLFFWFYVFNDVYAGEGVRTWVQALEALDAPGEHVIGYMGPGKRTGSSAQAVRVLKHWECPLDLYLNFQGTPYIYFTQSCSKILWWNSFHLVSTFKLSHDMP